MITCINYSKASDSIIRAIKQILGNEHYVYQKVYSGKSILITSKYPENETRIYIRVVYTDYGFAADISNITLNPDIQHKGIFTSIVNKLKNSKSINQIWVSSVLTPAMHKACKKLHMRYDESIQGYKLFLR